MLSTRAYALRATLDQGGCKSTRLEDLSQPSISKFPHIFPDLVAKSAQSALFAAGSALRFTKSKHLAATLPQMTIGLSDNGPTLHEVTQ